eukprot:scaffold5329_cov45-Phaeocystis_antarctica.AAC.1
MPAACARVLVSSIGEVTALVTAEHRPPASASLATRPMLSGTSLRIPPVMAVGIAERTLLFFLPSPGRPSGALAT